MNEALIDYPAIDPEEVRDAARRLLADHVDRRAPYAQPAPDQSQPLFAAMTELGWTLLTAPSHLDGLGQSFAALAPIYEEMGKVISPVALFPSLAGLELLAMAGTTAQAGALAAQVALGEAQVAVAFAGLGTIAVEASRIEGRLASVPADRGATHLLLLVEGDDPAAWLVELAAEGVTVDRPEMWDRSRSLIDITLHGASARPLLDGGGAVAIDRVRGHIDLALAWDSLGGARRSLEETIAYMLTRRQFGRPIGSFQALKHRAADHKVAIEIASAFVRDATERFARGDVGSAVGAGQARLIADDAYHAMAEDAVQLHGGIGFTWEHDCHVFLKRALLNGMLYGAPDDRRDQLAPAVLASAMQDGD